MVDYSWAHVLFFFLAFWSAWKRRNSAVEEEGDKISNVYSDVLSRGGNRMQEGKRCGSRIQDSTFLSFSHSLPTSPKTNSTGCMVITFQQRMEKTQGLFKYEVH